MKAFKIIPALNHHSEKDLHPMQHHSSPYYQDKIVGFFE